MKAALAGQRPSDGYFVEFWRLLVEYPEIIAWDRLFDLGKHQVLAEVRAAVKAVNPKLEVGFHIEHVNSFNPIFRATRSYADLAAKADFLKVVVYNNCGGERYQRFIENVGSTVFRDVPKDELLRFNNHLLGYGDEAGLEALPTAGLSPDYVARETKRALAGVAGKCRVLPGIDIGIPTGEHSRKASPEDTYAAVAAALKAGADGVMLSRKYSEMRLDNLAAAGRAVATPRPERRSALRHARSAHWGTNASCPARMEPENQKAPACRRVRGSPAARYSLDCGSMAMTVGAAARGVAAGFNLWPRLARASSVAWPIDGIDPQAAQIRRGLAERADEVVAHEPGGRHRFGRRQAEIDVVEQQLERHHVLVVATGDAHRQDRLPVLRHDRRRQRDPRPLARRDAVGMAGPEVERLQPRAEPDARVARHDPRPAAGRGRHDIPVLVGHQAGRRVVPGPPGPVRPARIGQQRLARSAGRPGGGRATHGRMSISRRRASAYAGASSPSRGTSSKSGSA